MPYNYAQSAGTLQNVTYADGTSVNYDSNENPINVPQVANQAINIAGNSTINPSMLESGTSNLSIPSPFFSSGAQEITNFANQQAQNYALQLTPGYQQAQQNFQQTQNQYQDLFELLGTRGDVQAQAQREFGFEEKFQKVTDINNQIAAKTHAFRREQERITNQAGLTMAQKNARLADVERKQASELADLAVIQSASLNDFNTAQSLVQQKVDMFVEPIKEQIQFTEKFLDLNYKILTTEQQNRLQAFTMERGRILEQETARLNDLENFKVETLRNMEFNNAPLALKQQLMKAQSKAEAAQIAGRYGKSLDERYKEAQLSKIYADIAEMSGDGVGQMTVEQAAQTSDKIEDINKILSDRFPSFSPNNPGMSLLESITGRNKVAIKAKNSPATKRKRQDTVSSIEQWVSQTKIESLQNAKASGATFGALSDAEWQILGEVGTRISQRAIKNKNDRVIGYVGSAEAMEKDLKVIQDLAKLDFYKKTGIVYPEIQYSFNPVTGNIETNEVLPNEDYFNQI